MNTVTNGSHVEPDANENDDAGQKQLRDAVQALVALICATHLPTVPRNAPPETDFARRRMLLRGQVSMKYDEAPQAFGSAVDSYSVSGSRSVRTGYFGQ